MSDQKPVSLAEISPTPEEMEDLVIRPLCRLIYEEGITLKKLVVERTTGALQKKRDKYKLACLEWLEAHLDAAPPEPVHKVMVGGLEEQLSRMSDEELDARIAALERKALASSLPGGER